MKRRPKAKRRNPNHNAIDFDVSMGPKLSLEASLNSLFAQNIAELRKKPSLTHVRFSLQKSGFVLGEQTIRTCAFCHKKFAGIKTQPWLCKLCICQANTPFNFLPTNGRFTHHSNVHSHELALAKGLPVIASWPSFHHILA